MRYGVQQGDGFIVVTGDIGAGKTTLVHTLLSELENEKDIVAAQMVTTQLDPDDLLRMVVEAFGINHEGLSKPAMLKKLESYLRKQSKAGKRVLLIVDEAQNLPVRSLEELRMLSNFQEGNKPLFQSFLLGQEGFRVMLKLDYLEQLRQRVIASYHLGPLSMEETKDYILHRLNLAGWKNDPLFSEEAYPVIYEYTGGIPRRINMLCNRVLLYSSIAELHEINVDDIKRVTQELDEEVVNVSESSERIALAGSKASGTKSNIDAGDDRLDKVEERLQRIEDFFLELEQSISRFKFR